MASYQRSVGTRPVFYFLGLIVAIGWLYVLFESDAFLINKVSASGLKSSDPVEVSREVLDILDHRPYWRPWPSRHAWFIDRQSLGNELKNRLFAANVTVDKSYSNVLRLKIEEQANKVIFHSHQQFFWIDLEGVATAELKTDERKQIGARLQGSSLPAIHDPPIIHQDLDELIVPGYRVSDEQEVKLWIQTASQFIQRGMAYREFQPPTASTTVAVLTSTEGYPVYVDIYAPLEPQIKTYLLFEKSKPAKFKVNEYVDVRVPGRVYVK